MSHHISRREFSRWIAMGLTMPFVNSLGASYTPLNFKIRTITAGLNISNPFKLKEAEQALDFLKQARGAFEQKGFEVQTLRMATQPLSVYLPDWSSDASMAIIKELDQFAVEHEINLSIGPVLLEDHYHKDFATRAVNLIQQTQRTSFTCVVASPSAGIHHQAIRCAAEAIRAIAHETPGGEGNFRFAATAFIPSGTPFFPAAWFDQGKSFSLGLESPNLLTAAFQDASSADEAKHNLATKMESAFRPLEDLGQNLAEQADWRYLGIDSSPAPGLDASIGEAIETLIKAPFGSASTLAGCAAITDVLKNLSVKTCGYSGLMLPTLEDIVLARRADEGRYGVSELLLYSNVCGTGLDVVPLPGDTSTKALAATILDVAALANKYQKPLSARLFPIPGKQAGELVTFDNPHLTDTRVMSL